MLMFHHMFDKCNISINQRIRNEKCNISINQGIRKEREINDKNDNNTDLVYGLVISICLNSIWTITLRCKYAFFMALRMVVLVLIGFSCGRTNFQLHEVLKIQVVQLVESRLDGLALRWWMELHIQIEFFKQLRNKNSDQMLKAMKQKFLLPNYYTNLSWYLQCLQRECAN